MRIEYDDYHCQGDWVTAHYYISPPFYKSLLQFNVTIKFNSIRIHSPLRNGNQT